MNLKQSLSDPDKADAAALLCRELFGMTEAKAPVEGGREATADSPAAEEFVRRYVLETAWQTSRPVRPAKRAGEIGHGANPRRSHPARSGAAGLESRSRVNGGQAWTISWFPAMRELLGSAQYRALESAWRSIQWLGERLESDDEVTAWLVDTGGSPPEDWVPSLAARIVQEIGSAGTIILLDEFDDSGESLESLRHVTAMASQTGARVFAGASHRLAGLAVDTATLIAADRSHLTESTALAWEQLRAEPGAAQVAIAFPHILLRQPYGQRSDPIESFAFEELAGPTRARCVPVGQPGNRNRADVTDGRGQGGGPADGRLRRWQWPGH